MYSSSKHRGTIMSFYKLEKASIEEAKQIIAKLDEEEKKVYLLKAADMPYISNEVFSLLVDCFKDHNHVLAQAFSEIAIQMAKDAEVNPKLDTLLATGTDFSQVASQSLINGAYRMNAQTAAWLIANGADACFSNNSALRNALAENNTPVVNELLKHGDNAQAYDHLVNNDTFHFDAKKIDLKVKQAVPDKLLSQ
jgi:hypothetical protein